MRDGPNRQYTRDWLQVDRPQPMYDKSIRDLYGSVYKKNLVDSADIINEFKSSFLDHLDGHSMSNLRGYRAFGRLDICIGCTQFIDDLYQRCGQHGVMVFENEYKYHWRLNNDIKFTDIDTLDPKKELLISMPFPAHGDVHPQMTEILDRCAQLRIPVHIDGAWVSCSRQLDFDFNHPAIQTFAISLSKGGLGNDRIALRFARARPDGAISIMNDFNMNCQSLIHIGLSYMTEIGPEYFWKKYHRAYEQICQDFNLTPTKAIHVAKTDAAQIVGIRPLLRCLVK
jgi:hypothetical protein